MSYTTFLAAFPGGYYFLMKKLFEQIHFYCALNETTEQADLFNAADIPNEASIKDHN